MATKKTPTPLAKSPSRRSALTKAASAGETPATKKRNGSLKATTVAATRKASSAPRRAAAKTTAMRAPASNAAKARAHISRMLGEVQAKNDELTERVGRLLARLR